MDKFAKYLLFLFVLFFAFLIVTSGIQNLGLYENMENNDESPHIMKKESQQMDVYDF